MLVRIAREEVRIGMFVERLEGAWTDHPFWKRRFLLEEFADVERLLGSDVEAVVIDIAKGVGVAAPVASEAFEGLSEAIEAEAVVNARPDLARIGRALDQSRQLVETIFARAGAGQPIETAEAALLVDDIAGAMRRNPTLLVQITRLKTKDEGTFVHSIAVCALMIQFARYLRMDEEKAQLLGMCGLLHDIGKVALPPEILSKADRLTDAETRLVQRHPIEGHALLAEQPDLSPLVREICLNHHERVDGRGYPNGLKGEAIALEVRMASICDVYDALTSVRSYRATWSSAQALGSMLDWTGQFDRLLLLQFAASLGMRLSNAPPPPAVRQHSTA